jgi:tetratricopeptide (TPR) repeat protein
LSGLEGVDSSLDQWLTNAREEQRLRHRGLGLPRADQYPSLDPGWTAIGPSIMVAEIETHGQQQYPTSSRELRNEIELTLTQLRWCSVIASTSIRRRRSSAADYCLICRVNPANESCRLSVCLSECREGTIVMSAEIDTPNEPRETLNRRLADRVAARLDSELLLIEARRHRGVRGSRKDDAYRLVLDAVPAIYRLEHLAFMRAGHSLDLAVVANRESTIAYTWLALWQIFLVGQGWAENRSRSMSLASRAAERALLLDPRDARALTVAGHVHAFLGCRIQEAIMLHQEALKMNPALPLAWALSGMAHAYAGRLEDALERLSYCLELAPHDPHSFLASHGLAVVYLLRGEYERATAFGRLVTEQAPCFTSGYKSYLSALGHIGSREEALRVCERLRALEPGFSLRDFHRRGLYRLSENQNRFTQGLRLAGLR